MRPPSEAELRRLQTLFAELCAVPSPTGDEEAVRALVRRRLERLGVEVHDDEAGNLLARVAPRGEGGRSVALCAHLDTVPVAGGVVEPVEVDGGWENRRDAILGADNKAAVAVMLLAFERAATEFAPVGVELLLTVGEEDALAGAKRCDVAALRSDFGFVFDHASPIGEIVMGTPTYYRLRAAFHGAAAHAGIRPEAGRSAILAAATAITALRLGRVDDETTASVASVWGGSDDGSTNVVPAHAGFLAEARSLDADKVERLVQEMIDRTYDAANRAECAVDVDVTVERLFDGYRHAPSAPAVRVAEAALSARGFTPTRIVTGGASDANALESAGFACTNLANGTERNHEPTERVSFAALEQMLGVTYALLDAAAEA